MNEKNVVPESVQRSALTELGPCRFWLVRRCTVIPILVFISCTLVVYRTLQDPSLSPAVTGHSRGLKSLEDIEPPHAPLDSSPTVDRSVTSAAVLEALGWSFIAGISTGFGGLVVLCVDAVDGALNAFLLGQAAGVMIGLSLLDMLIPNITLYGWQACAFYFAIGWAAVMLLARYTEGLDDWLHSVHGDSDGEDGSPSDSPKRVALRKQRVKRAKTAILTTLALALHNAPEGLAVGITSLQSSVHRKIFVAAAISLHNIPEGTACAAAVYQATQKRWWSLFIATMSGMVEPVFAVLSVLVLGPFLTMRLIDLSLVGVSGVMITVSIRELIPQAVEASATYASIGIVSGFALVQLGLYYLHP